MQHTAHLSVSGSTFTNTKTFDKMKIYAVSENFREKTVSQQSIISPQRFGKIDEGELQEGPEEKGRWRILKNFFCFSFAFTLMLLPQNSLESLQSSLNSEGGLGVATIATCHATSIICSLIVSPTVLGYIGEKRTMMLAWCCVLLYYLANSYAAWFTLIPAGMLMGAGFSLAWAAFGTLLTSIATDYAHFMKRENIQPTIDLFFGAFLGIFNSGRIWGELISSNILMNANLAPIEDEDELAHINETGFVHKDVCGAEFCPNSNLNNTNIIRPSEQSIYILVGAFLGLTGLAFLLIILLDAPKLKADENAKMSDRLVQLFKQHRSLKLCLLTPMLIFTGVRNSLILGDFNQAYVSCELGIGYIGMSMLCLAICNTLTAPLFGLLSKWLPSYVLVTVAMVMNAISTLVMLMWEPSTDQYWLFFALPGFYGVAHSICQTQENVLIARLCPEDLKSSFIIRNMWQSFGFAFSFAINGFLCVWVKAYINLGLLIVVMICYFTLEILLHTVWCEDNNAQDNTVVDLNIHDNTVITNVAHENVGFTNSEAKTICDKEKITDIDFSRV
ncbi:unnamed protein product [Owenia fusiformis]|uniref:Protein unc-93 homolog A n=1 Tax=Owenia fusiformis TaxID=6347 RepID=A0A8S4N191_OWEFU|nr:unnamed protein product [Owenia fusiformis]